MRRLLAGALVVALTGCTSDPPEAEPESTPTVSTSPTPTVEPDPGVDNLVIPPAAASMPASWREVFVIPYGPGPALLGTSPGGDSGSLDIGPEYGAPGPDGTWWFLDSAKQRVAHYDAVGAYLEQVKVTTMLGLTLFQWQLPHVLADGTLVAARQDPPNTLLLRCGTVSLTRWV